MQDSKNQKQDDMKGLLTWLLNEAKDKGFLVVILLIWGYVFLQRYDNCNLELINNLKEQNSRAVMVIENNNKILDDHNKAIEANARAIENFSMYLRKNGGD